MRSLLLSFVLLFSFYSYAENQPEINAIEISNVLMENHQALVKLKSKSEKVEIFKIEKNDISETESSFLFIADKIVQGDVIVGQATLKIMRTLKGSNPEDFFYQYTSEIIEN